MKTSYDHIICADASQIKEITVTGVEKGSFFVRKVLRQLALAADKTVSVCDFDGLLKYIKREGKTITIPAHVVKHMYA